MATRRRAHRVERAPWHDNLHQELNQDIPLSQMITSLREEIAVARAKAQEDNNGIRMPIQEVEVEMSVKIVKGAKGLLKLSVLQGDIARGAESLHRFKIKMKVTDDGHTPIDVSQEHMIRPG